MNNKFVIFTILICVIISLGIFSMFSKLVYAQGAGGAYFTSIKVTNGNGVIDLISGGTAKVYRGQAPVQVNLTYYNQYNGIFGADLYVKFYVDSLSSTGSESYVTKGSSNTEIWPWSGGLTYAGTVNCKVELWWDNWGTHSLQDTKYFSIYVVDLFVTNWTPSSLSLEKGKTTASTWPVSLENGGNDLMYSASISIVDDQGLLISPLSANLGDIAIQGTKSTSFSVLAPFSVSAGLKIVTFQIVYSDFRGNNTGSHTESRTASVVVNRLDTNVTLTLETANVKILEPRFLGGGSTTFTAKLLDGNGNPISNANIKFQMYVGSTWTDIGSPNTDSNGIASITYTPSNTGTFQIRALYEGTADYAESTSETSSLIVDSDYTPYYAIIAAIVVAIVAVAVGVTLYFRRRSRAPTPPPPPAPAVSPT